MASPPGAVPPSADGEPDLPPGIAPPPELGVSATISAAPDAVAASVAGWAGSADAHAAAWAAYQQQCAYQHAGADWGAYNAAWANEWARHNEAAAAAAAAPSAERLAAVAAKIAEQIAEAEKNENETRRVAPASAPAEAKEATTAGPPGILPADGEAKQPEEPDVMGTDLEVSPPPPPPPPPSRPPSPPPAPPEPADRRGAGDAETKTSARAEPSPNRAARRDPPGPRSDRSAPALIPRQIPAPSAPRGADGVEPRRARGATWQVVAADALGGGGGEKGAVAAEKARLALEIETSRARLFPSDAKARETPRRDGDGEARDEASRKRRLARDARDARDGGVKKKRIKKDVAYWERHYAAKHGIPLDDGFETTVSEPGTGGNEPRKSSRDNPASREGSSAAATATGLPEADEHKSAEVEDRARGGARNVGVSLSRETLRANARDPLGPARETRHDARRGETREENVFEKRGGISSVNAAFNVSRTRRPLINAARASRAWGPNGTPPDSPERGEEKHRFAAAARSPSSRDDDVPSSSRRAFPEATPRAETMTSRARDDLKDDKNDALARTKKKDENDDERRGVFAVVLRGLTTREELMDPAEAEEIEKETALECEAFGEVREVRVVRPNPLGAAFDPEDVGAVFLSFADDAAAERARKSLHGRTFADRPVVAERAPR